MSMADRVVILTGTLKGREVPIEGVLSIGRSPGNSIQIDDLQVSRKHARIIEKDDGLYLVDLGSGNGTYIGGERIVEHRLSDGDVFRMGRQQIQFRVGARKRGKPSKPWGDHLEAESKAETAADAAENADEAEDPDPEVAVDTPDPDAAFFAGEDDEADDIGDTPDIPDHDPDVFGDADTPGESDDDAPDIPDHDPEFFDAPKDAQKAEDAVKATATADVQEPAEENIESRQVDNLYQTFFQAPAADAQVESIQKRLRAVYAANQTIASERSLDKVFDTIMREVFSLINAHNGLIMLKQDGSDELSVEYVRSADSNTQIHVSSSIISRVFDKGEAVITSNAADDSRFGGGMSIINANISSALCAPLTHQDEKLGVIYVDNRGTMNAFTDSDLEMLVALAAPAATAIKNAQYVKMVEQAYEDTLVALANAIELRDHYTVGHTWRVTNFAMEIARELGWAEEKLEEVQMGGVLHDVGKIAVDNAILGKPGALTEEEFAQMKVHPERGADLLRDIKYLHPLIPYCLCHHERWDGTGYPKGLQNEEIPIEGRLIAVADAFDAMTSTRPYRKGMKPEVALERLAEGKGKQFDPSLVDALERCYKQGRIDSVLQDYFKNEARSTACPFCSTFIRFDDTVQNGSEIECPVCHKQVRVVEKEGTYFGVLVNKEQA